MSERYEMIYAKDDRAVHVAPGSTIGADVLESHQHALVLGDPDATALVVIGRHGDLRDYLTAALAALDGEPERWGDEDDEEQPTEGECEHCGQDIERAGDVWRTKDAAVMCPSNKGGHAPLRECPACGDPDGPCEVAPCGDPDCISRDCECHDACEPAKAEQR